MHGQLNVKYISHTRFLQKHSKFFIPVFDPTNCDLT